MAGPWCAACRSVGTSRWPSPRANPAPIRGLVLSGATAEPVGPRSLLYLALAGVMDRVEDERLDRLNARFFRTRYPPEIAEPIVAGGFWSKGGAQALRALVGERFIPRLAAYPGPTLILNGELDVIFRLSAPGLRRRRGRPSPGPPGRRDAPRQPRSPARIQRRRSAASPARSRAD